MTFPVRGQRLVLGFMATHAAMGARFAERIGLDPAVGVAIGQAYEQWDGKGVPARLAGRRIGLPARLVQLASGNPVHDAEATLYTTLQGLLGMYEPGSPS